MSVSLELKCNLLGNNIITTLECLQTGSNESLDKDEWTPNVQHWDKHAGGIGYLDEYVVS